MAGEKGAPLFGSLHSIYIGSVCFRCLISYAKYMGIDANEP
jgi:hypothetical protein